MVNGARSRLSAYGDDASNGTQGARDAFVRLDTPDPPVTIDAEARVPWRDVVNVMNLCKKNRIDRIEFALLQEQR